MLPKRLDYVISTILCYQNVWIMLYQLYYVTKTFELCYQNVWIMLPKRLDYVTKTFEFVL